jgi:hypothetical protein
MIYFPFKHFIKHSFSDSIENLKSSFIAAYKYKSYSGGSRGCFPPSDYETVFEDNFNSRINLEKWRYGQAWGDFHPRSLHQYYDNDGTLSYVSKDNYLVLELRNKPKSWIKKDLPDWRTVPDMPEEFTIPVGIGMVSSIDSWQYGWFEAWIKLPEGTPYWPAFWLSGVNSWPPEIDILEAYSNKGNLYSKKNFWGKFIPNQKIQPNIHYGRSQEGTKKMYGAWDVPVAKCTDRFVQYACLWEKDRIEIYYDGIRVFKCMDPKILESFNTKDAKQNIIINHGYHQNAKTKPTESSMLIKSVKVLQKK